MALNGLNCAYVPLRNYSLTHAFQFICDLIGLGLQPKCYISRGMRVRNSKSNLQGHWYWCYSRKHIRFPITVPLQLSDLNRFRDIISYSPKFRDHVTMYTSRWR